MFTVSIIDDYSSKLAIIGAISHVLLVLADKFVHSSLLK